MEIEEEKDTPIRTIEPLEDPVPRREPKPEPVKVPEKEREKVPA